VERAKSAKAGGSRRAEKRTDSRLDKRGEEALESGRRYQKQLAAGKYLMPDQPSSSMGSTALKQNPDYFNEQYQLLEKLMSNLKENPALQNVYIRDIFNLHAIHSESDL
jgi:hypothetical protein